MNEIWKILKGADLEAEKSKMDDQELKLLADGLIPIRPLTPQERHQLAADARKRKKLSNQQQADVQKKSEQ